MGTIELVSLDGRGGSPRWTVKALLYDTLPRALLTVEVTIDGTTGEVVSTEETTDLLD